MKRYAIKIPGPHTDLHERVATLLWGVQIGVTACGLWFEFGNEPGHAFCFSTNCANAAKSIEKWIGNYSLHLVHPQLEAAAALPVCKLCHKPIPAWAAAHLHQGEHIGNCCWDDRLHSTE